MRCLSEQAGKVLIGLQIIVSDWCRFSGALFRNRSALAAENLFLRKQLAVFREREKKLRATTVSDRFVLSRLARLFEWRSTLVIVQPATLISWHRSAFRRFGVGSRDPLEDHQFRSSGGG